MTRSWPTLITICCAAAGSTRRRACGTRPGAAYRKNTGELVGDLCFKGPSAQPEIGYGMIEAFWGRGYATESAGAMCRWALAQPGVTAVEAETAPDNAASIRVLAKLGFQPTGTLGEEGPRFLLKKSPDTP